MGFYGGLLITACSFALLYFIAFSIVRISILYKMDTMEMILCYFGARGAMMCSLIIATAFFSWMMWQLRFLLSFFKNILPNEFQFITWEAQSVIIVVALLFFVLIGNLRGLFLKIVPKLLFPMTVISLISVVIFFPTDILQPQKLLSTSSFTFSAIFSLLGSVATTCLGIPTFYKFSSSVDVGIKSLKLVCLVFLPLFMLVGIVLGIFSPTLDVFDLFKTDSGKWIACLSLYATLGCLSACIANLHYCVEAVSYIFGLKNSPQIILLVTLAILLVMFSDMQFLTINSTYISNIVIGLITVIVARIYVDKMNLNINNKFTQRHNCYALAFSNFVSFLSVQGYVEITSSPFFDSILSALFMLMYFYSKNNSDRKAVVR